MALKKQCLFSFNNPECNFEKPFWYGPNCLGRLDHVNKLCEIYGKKLWSIPCQPSG
jgi:hypothetical protein